MRIPTLLTILVILLALFSSFSASKEKILIVTGGHEFYRVSFFQMFDSFDQMSFTELVQSKAGIQLEKIDLATFDAVVFYHMPKTITDEEKKGYYRLLKAGKGLLFLHYSICAYQDWPEYESIVCGKYYEKKKNDQFGASSYLEDIGFAIKIEHKSHPVTKGLKDFNLQNEVYGNLEVLPGVYPLIFTSHPKSNVLIGWTLKKDNSKIAFLQPGHDKFSYTNPNYRRLISQAII